MVLTRFFIISSIFFIPAFSVYAQIDNPLKAQSLTDLISNIIDALLLIVIPLIVVAIVFIGFSMVYNAAIGNSEKLKENKIWLLYALLGSALILSVYGIKAVIEQTADEILVQNTEIYEKDIAHNIKDL
ncbi:MAG: hypothetical protein OXU73_01830 [Candidatus Campbellbacteria bacterium]|nr:hypothetical protein [Candidatus Campbellbacteria bacterium]